MKKEFENTLSLTKIALLITGVKLYQSQWNHILERFIHKYLYYINFIILYAVIFGEIYWVIDGIQTGKSFVEISLTWPCITISILATVKSWTLYYNSDILSTVVNKLRALQTEYKPLKDVVDEEAKEIGARNKIIDHMIKFLKLVVLLLLSISAIVFIVFCFSPLFEMGYEYYVTGITVIKYPFLVKYSFDVYNTSWWGLIYFIQVWATAIVVVNLFGCDTLFYALCSTISMHFRLLGIEFENIVSKTMRETKIRINMAVERHQELMEMVDRTQSMYSYALLFNIVTSSLLICLSAFNITVAKDFRTIFAYITFLTMSLSQISLLCFFGDMLMKSSTEVSRSIYNCRWYDVDVDLKKTILIALMRAQKPCRLRAANFADLNLGAFTTILSRSWSYFALLKSVYN